MSLSFAIAALTMLPGTTGDYRFQSEYRLPLADMVQLDGTCIVEGVRRGTPIPRGQPLFDVEYVRVLDSLRPMPSGEVRVVIVRGNDPSPVPALEAGKRYLILALRAGQQGVRVPNTEGTRIASFTRIGDAEPDDLIGLARFETRRQSLAIAENDQDRVLLSLADTLAGTTNATVKAVADFVIRNGLPEQSTASTRPTGGRSDPPFTLRLLENAQSGSAYARVRVHEIRNKWHVWGSADDLLDAIAACANDPTLFSSGDGIPEIDDFESGFGTGAPPRYQPRERDPETWIARLESARNVAVKRYILREGFPAPSEALKRRFARILNDPDRHCRAFVARQLAGWERDYEKGPQIEYGRNLDTGEATYAFPNLEEVLPYWRQRYGVPEP